MKPYFKFKLPLLDLCAEEEDAWRRASKTTATCMTKMYRHQSSPDAVECLVVGTEDTALYIIDPIKFSVLTKYTLPAVPVHLCANGSFDVDYRIVVSCRNGVIYQIKRETLTISDGINPGSQIVGLVRLEKSIIVGCMDQTIKGFSLQGHPIWSVCVPSPILTVVPINLSTHSFHGYIVSLKNGDVRVYQEQHICDTVFHWTEVKPNHETPSTHGIADTGDAGDQHTNTNDVANEGIGPQEKLNQNEPSSSFGTSRLNRIPKCDPVIAAQFGPFDREAGSLALITHSGALCLLLVKRSAQFRPLDVISRHPNAQMARLELPKKTKLFLDLADREKEHAHEIYGRYNHDLVLLRCTVAKAFLELLQTRSGPLAVHGAKRHLKLSARVYGLGPNYTLVYELIETQANENWCSTNMGIFLDFDDTVYQVTAPYIPVSHPKSSKLVRF
ncbi:Bardet-Biedl syndrome 1 protein [Paragonimus westermani]|uniref:Bardet-Biedl syndrome 1 protein n=1 Tax=Paragonimus westermani TaxID=34504 RepID=A0A5J4P3H2_9TREM|nr:Bardet-Biedl syndrome 1 protein [Paragonimus westermani]